MNRAETYSTRFPVQPAPGNHEGAANFSEFKIRHGGVAAHSNTGSAMFYSMEVRAGTPQGVHFLAFNSETYVDGGIEEMLNFMREDLAAVDRKRTPWVVAFSHKHWWMDSTDFSEITGILQEGGVDLLFAGHWHYYQRMAPIYPTTPWQVDVACLSNNNHTATDPKFMTMIVSGAIGDVERNDGCPGAANLVPVTTACSAAYGYGILTVSSATKVSWSFTAWTTPIGAVLKAPPVDYTDTYEVLRSAPPA